MLTMVGDDVRNVVRIQSIIGGVNENDSLESLLKSNDNNCNYLKPLNS